MWKLIFLLSACLLCAQAEPVRKGHESVHTRGREAKSLGFLSGLFDKAKDLVKKAAPAIISKVLPPSVGNLVSSALPILTGGGSITDKILGVGQQVLGSGLLPSSVSNVASTALNAVQGFQNGGLSGAVNAVTGGQGIGSLLPGGSSGALGSIVNNVAGSLLGGGSSGGANNIGSILNTGGIGAATGVGAATTGAAGTAANAHQQVLNQGATGGVTTAGPPPVSAPVPPPVPPPVKPLPQVSGKSSGSGQPSSPGNPAVWKGNAVDPSHAMSGTTVSGIKGGSGDAASGFTMKGRYGAIKMQADGTWEYDLDESNALVKAYGDRANALFDVFALEFTGTPPAETEIRIHVWEHYKKSP